MVTSFTIRNQLKLLWQYWNCRIWVLKSRTLGRISELGESPHISFSHPSLPFSSFLSYFFPYRFPSLLFTSPSSSLPSLPLLPLSLSFPLPPFFVLPSFPSTPLNVPPLLFHPPSSLDPSSLSLPFTHMSHWLLAISKVVIIDYAQSVPKEVNFKDGEDGEESQQQNHSTINNMEPPVNHLLNCTIYMMDDLAPLLEGNCITLCHVW